MPKTLEFPPIRMENFTESTLFLAISRAHVKFTDENFNCNPGEEISSNVLASDGRPKAFIPKVNGLIRRWGGPLKAGVARRAAPFKVLQSALWMGFLGTCFRCKIVRSSSEAAVFPGT